jgi:DNA-binding NarL/FixJ family response regulator
MAFRCSSNYATAAVVVLSALRAQDTELALDLGAVSFISKTTERDMMLSALQLVFSAGVYMPKEILDGDK